MGGEITMITQDKIWQRDDLLLAKEARFNATRMALACVLVLWVAAVFVMRLGLGIQLEGAFALLVTLMLSYSLLDSQQKLKHIQSVKLHRNELERYLQSAEQ
jgi:hypothetical protein